MSRHGPVATFWALSDPLRVDILDRVAGGRSVTVSDLAAELPISRQAVTRHLRTLEEAALLKGERSGRERRYQLDTAAMTEATEWLALRTRSWDAALERLAAFVEPTDQVDETHPPAEPARIEVRRN